MINNRLKLGSSLIRANLIARRWKTAESVKKPSYRKSKILIAATTLPLGGFYIYYQSVLNDQEKRRVRVNIKSFFRAFRFV